MTGTVSIGHRGLVVDGVEERLFSAEFHYWRTERERWGDVLDTLAGLGFRSVCTYVSWARHEVAAGAFDFDTGSLDLDAFLGLVGARGLRAVVRIGPDTACEQEDSGYPRRILDDPECQARRPGGEPYVLLSATGHCFPPSYASRAFRDEVARWYDAVVPVVARHQHPDGPVVLVQLDNELGYHFQANTYALDYHPDAIAAFRRFVDDPHAEPPRDAGDGTEQDRVAWVGWREHHRRETLAHLRDLARGRGISVPVFHNDYPRTTTPMDLGALERSGAVDLAAADIYTTKEGGRFVRDLARHLCGSSRLPFLAELGAGWLTLPWLLPLPVSAADEEHVALRAVTSGVRAANVYMAVERDRWYGSPVASDGTARPKAALYPRLFELLDQLRWHELERVVPVLVVDNRAEARRVAARDTLGDVVPSFTQLLPIDHRLTRVPHPDTETFERWEREVVASLDQAGVDHDRASSSALPDLGEYDAVVVTALDAFEPGAWSALTAAASSGDVRLLVGPRLPSVDDRLRPHAFDATNVEVLTDPADVVGLVPAPRWRASSAAVDVTCWRDGARDREVVVTANASADVVDAELSGPPGPLVLRGAWTPEVVKGDGRVAIHLEPFAIQVWEVSA